MSNFLLVLLWVSPEAVPREVRELAAYVGTVYTADAVNYIIKSLYDAYTYVDTVVVYGPDFERTIQVQVDRKELERFYLNYGLEYPFSLVVDGDSQRVVIREVQMNNLKRAPVHVDFYAPKR